MMCGKGVRCITSCQKLSVPGVAGEAGKGRARVAAGCRVRGTAGSGGSAQPIAEALGAWHVRRGVWGRCGKVWVMCEKDVQYNGATKCQSPLCLAMRGRSCVGMGVGEVQHKCEKGVGMVWGREPSVRICGCTSIPIFRTCAARRWYDYGTL